MSVSREDVKHVATLARLALTDARAEELTVQLNGILAHMDALRKVDTGRREPVAGVGADSAPLAPDAGPSVPLQSSRESFAPAMRDGFFIVPRLATHETAEES